MWLWAGLASACLGFSFPFVSSDWPVTFAGWLLGGMVAIGLLGVFLWRDLERRSLGFAADSPAVDWLRRLLVVAAVAAVAHNAWVLADALARRSW